MKIRNRLTTLAVATLASAALVMGGAVPANAASVGTSTTGTIYPGQWLGNGAYSFRVQTDGNVVLYRNFGGSSQKACWASNTAGLKGTYVQFVNPPWSNPDHAPRIHIINNTYGIKREYRGKSYWPKSVNLSLNSKGEVWIGYAKWISCG